MSPDLVMWKLPIFGEHLSILYLYSQITIASWESVMGRVAESSETHEAKKRNFSMLWLDKLMGRKYFPLLYFYAQGN